MITSNTKKLFGGKVATIETPSFACFISTAKDGFFHKQSMVIFDTTDGFTNRRVVAKIVYNDLLDSNARLELHDRVIHTIDASGNNGIALSETLIGLFEDLQKEGIGTAIFEKTWWDFIE